MHRLTRFNCYVNEFVKSKEIRILQNDENSKTL